MEQLVRETADYSKQALLLASKAQSGGVGSDITDNHAVQGLMGKYVSVGPHLHRKTWILPGYNANHTSEAP